MTGYIELNETDPTSEVKSIQINTRLFTPFILISCYNLRLIRWKKERAQQLIWNFMNHCIGIRPIGVFHLHLNAVCSWFLCVLVDMNHRYDVMWNTSNHVQIFQYILPIRDGFKLKWSQNENSYWCWIIFRMFCFIIRFWFLKRHRE